MGDAIKRMGDAIKSMLFWNRCDVCGRFIALADFASARARRALIYPDSEYSRETWETLCAEHAARKSMLFQRPLSPQTGSNAGQREFQFADAEMPEKSMLLQSKGEQP